MLKLTEHRLNRRALLDILLSVVLLAPFATAQSDRASIVGTITDPSRSTLAEVQVTATNVATNVTTSSKSNFDGIYELLNLPIGDYALTFSKAGFTRLERKGIALHVRQVAEINVQLAIGVPTELVTVTANAPILQTETASITTNLSNNSVTELPLNVKGGRTLSTFMFSYVSGVEGNDYDSHILGSLSKSKEVMIDGTSAVAQIGGYLNESQPPMESVEEFQVTTVGIRADEARSGGGVFRYNLKSGSNQWHGSGLLYLHNEALDANSWSNNYHGFVRPDDRLYDYGASFGGPIIRNKTFFFGAWERYTFANYGLGGLNATVPTTAFLNGDFSALLDTTKQIGTDTGGHPVYKGALLDPATGLAFSGNMIPANRFSKVSQKIIAIYRSKYQPLSSALTNNNAMPANVAPWNQSNAFSIKLDHVLNNRHRLAGSFIYEEMPRLLADQGGVWSPGSTDGGPFANSYDHHTTAPSVRVSDSIAVSSNVLNVATFTFNRYRNPSIAASEDGNWPSTLGLGDFGSGNFPILKFQGVDGNQFRTSVDGTSIYESPLGSQFNGFYAANTFVYGDNLSWTRGRHTLKFGTEFRVMQFNSHGDSGVPTFYFDPAQTAGKFGGNAGFGFASFLLGAANQAAVSTPNNTYGRRKSLALYAMDSWKVTPKLTMNFDLRWDFNGRYHEKYGRWSNYSAKAINPATGQPGALEFAQNGDDSFERDQNYHNFSGTIGGAYQLAERTVVRASFGLFYVPLNLNFWSGIPYGFNPGFSQNNQYVSRFQWDNGYPGHAVDVGKDPNFTRWGMVATDPRSLDLGNIQQWSIGIQQAITNNLRLDISYIQNRGYHLQSGYLAGNQPQLSQYTASANAGTLWDWVDVPGFSGFQWAALTPFPNVANTYGPLLWVGSPLGNSDYQSLQFNVTRQYSRGLTLQASYNYSSSHGDTDTSFQELWWAGPLQDIYNLQQERHTISPFDMTHTFKGFVVYDLPFGKGKSILSTAGNNLDAIIGGWTVSLGFLYNSGTPIRIVANTYYPGINIVYANLGSNCDIGKNFNGQVNGTYFNSSCFSNPDYGAFGNAPGYLSDLRYPGLATEDIGINKTLSFGERYRLSLRFQMFNALNRHRFSGPNTSIGDPRFGTVPAENLNGQDPRIGQFGARFTF